MRSRARLALLVSVACVVSACPAPPVRFRVIAIEEAKRLVETNAVVLVEVPPALMTAPKDPSAPVHRGAAVLVFGNDLRSTRVRAAALARAGSHPVLVFVPRDAEERGRFYAVASPDQEVRRGEDS